MVSLGADDLQIGNFHRSLLLILLPSNIVIHPESMYFHNRNHDGASLAVAVELDLPLMFVSLL